MCYINIKNMWKVYEKKNLLKNSNCPLIDLTSRVMGIQLVKKFPDIMKI